MALEPLATVDDLEDRLQRTLAESEQIRADTLLRDASATVRAYARQDFTAVEDDEIRLRVKNGKVRLPQRPVTAVSSVATTAGDDLVFAWYSGDAISVNAQGLDAWAWEPFTTSPQFVDVTYSHGYGEIPEVVVKIVCRIAATALDSPMEDAGTTSESIAGYSYSRGAIAASGGLFEEEKRELDAYRAVGGSAWVSS